MEAILRNDLRIEYGWNIENKILQMDDEEK